MSIDKEDKIQLKIKRLSNLPQYKNKTPEEIRAIVIEKVEKQVQKIEQDIGSLATKQEISDSLWLDDKEAKKAEMLYNEYKSNGHIEKLSDLNILKDVVYLEIVNERYKQNINICAGNEEKTHQVSKLLEVYLSSLTQLVALKDKLFGKNEEKDFYQFHATLKKKFVLWRKENKGTRTRRCPHCSKEILFMIRLDEYLDPIKHPWYKSRFLYNEHLFQLYIQGKLTKMDVAKVLQGKDVQSTDYVDWVLEKVQLLVNQDENKLLSVSLPEKAGTEL